MFAGMPMRMTNRRHFLRGLGGVCLALPAFESLQSAEAKDNVVAQMMVVEVTAV